MKGTARASGRCAAVLADRQRGPTRRPSSKDRNAGQEAFGTTLGIGTTAGPPGFRLGPSQSRDDRGRPGKGTRPSRAKPYSAFASANAGHGIGGEIFGWDLAQSTVFEHRRLLKAAWIGGGDVGCISARMETETGSGQGRACRSSDEDRVRGTNDHDAGPNLGGADHRPDRPRGRSRPPHDAAFWVTEPLLTLRWRKGRSR